MEKGQRIIEGFKNSFIIKYNISFYKPFIYDVFMRKNFLKTAMLIGMAVGSIFADMQEAEGDKRCYGSKAKISSKDNGGRLSWMFMRSYHSHYSEEDMLREKRGGEKRTPFAEIDERPVLGVAPDYLFGGLKYENIYPRDFRSGRVFIIPPIIVYPNSPYFYLPYP